MKEAQLPSGKQPERLSSYLSSCYVESPPDVESDKHKRDGILLVKLSLLHRFLLLTGLFIHSHFSSSFDSEDKGFLCVPRFCVFRPEKGLPIMFIRCRLPC